MLKVIDQVIQQRKLAEPCGEAGDQVVPPMVQELDYQLTPIGELILRCRQPPHTGSELVYEVKLDGQMLMSSSVTESERALARMALECNGNAPCDVLIGGLGLGYTAVAALDYPHVRRVDVVELLAPVIAWHRAGLVPTSEQLVGDPRCTLIEGDFFELVGQPWRDELQRYDVILVDIDHSPDALLHPRHQTFYTEAGLVTLAKHIRPDGTFGLWSAVEPPADVLKSLARVFASVCSHEVQFFNPHVCETDSNWIIIAHQPRRGQT